MNLKFFNLIVNYFEYSTIKEKVSILLEKGVCRIEDEKIQGLINLLEDLDFYGFKTSEIDKEIADIPYLYFNEIIVEEMADHVAFLLEKNFNQMSSYGVFIRRKYERDQLVAVNDQLREKLILKTLKKVSKRIEDICTFELHSFIRPTKHLSTKILPELVTSFYSQYRVTEDEDIKNLIKLDIINHVAPNGDGILNYGIGEIFFDLQDLLNFIETLKADLAILEHNSRNQKLLGKPIHNINNVFENYNRAPLVFKNPYECELFIYALMSEDIKKTIIFSYYFSIFKSQNKFRRKIEPKNYLDFINKLYGLNEIRLRDAGLSSRLENKIINRFNNLEKSFDKEIADKQ